MRYLFLLALLFVLGCGPSRKEQYQGALAELNEETELLKRMQRELAAFDAETQRESDTMRQTLDRRLQTLGDGQITLESIRKDEALSLSDLERKRVAGAIDMAMSSSIRLWEERDKKRELIAAEVDKQRERVHQAKEKLASLSGAAK